jgi:hypothetical protein
LQVQSFHIVVFGPGNMSAVYQGPLELSMWSVNVKVGVVGTAVGMGA